MEELSKYQKTKIELEQLNANLKELDIPVGSQKMTGMPHSNNIKSPVENIVMKKIKIKNVIEKRKSALLEEQLKIEHFLESIDDITIRIIIRARFIEGKNWHQIGKELNFERTTPYYHLKKYLKGYEKNEKEKSI